MEWPDWPDGVQTFLQDETPAVLLLYDDWCPACAAGKAEFLAAESILVRHEVRAGLYNIQGDWGVVGAFGQRAVPTYVVSLNGQLTVCTGSRTLSELCELVGIQYQLIEHS